MEDVAMDDWLMDIVSGDFDEDGIVDLAVTTATSIP